MSTDESTSLFDIMLPGDLKHTIYYSVTTMKVIENVGQPENEE